jgi:thiol oxidase
MTSNFFAVLDGALHTAGEGVLLGSVRHVVLQVAAAQGVPVVLAPPPLARLDEWEAAMISSTSRLLLPVDELAAPEQNPPLVRSFARGGVAAALEAGVLAEVARRSEPLPVPLAPPARA